MVYIGFILINIELLEIVVDGILGTHRIFAPYLGGFYNVLIGSFEILAALVLVAVIIFGAEETSSEFNVSGKTR